MARLDLRGIRKSFGKQEVLHGVDLSVEDGEFVVFVGPSGCGKSTLLRLICGLDEISAGQMLIDGEVVNDVPAARRGLAMVFQSYALYPHMTVAENLGYALRLARTPKPEIDVRVRRAAETLQITELLARKPRQLSGGQRQRVAIGRAIVREPRIFLFDEPLSNLDASLRVEMRFEIARLKARLGTTMIYVTHDQTEAMTLADRIVVMRAGLIEQVGSPLELYRSPANRFVAGFIGSPRMNFLDAEATGQGAQGLEISLPQGVRVALSAAAPGERSVTLGIRPEHLVLGDVGRTGSISGRVAATEHLGSDTFVFLDVETVRGPVLVRLAGEKAVRPGETVGVTFDGSQAHLFGSDGVALARHPAPSPSAVA